MKAFLKTNINLKLTEIFLLFVVSPIILFLSIPIVFKVVYLLLGVIYITLISIFIESFQKTKIDHKLRNRALKHIVFRFLIIALLTIAILYTQNKEALFNVMLNKPTLWLKFSGIYILFSVIPQETHLQNFFCKTLSRIDKK